MRSPTLVLVLALAACATPSESTADLEPSEDPRVGEEADRICFSGTINGFGVWDKGEGLILNRGVSDRYLVTFTGSCTNIDAARAVGLSSDLTGAGCVRRADRIFISDTIGGSNRPFSTQSCVVDRIYHYDPDAEAAPEAAE